MEWHSFQFRNNSAGIGGTLHLYLYRLFACFITVLTGCRSIIYISKLSQVLTFRVKELSVHVYTLNEVNPVHSIINT